MGSLGGIATFSGVTGGGRTKKRSTLKWTAS